MDTKFLNDAQGGKNFEHIQKGFIASNFTNADEMMKSDAEVEFENSIRKGEVEVLSVDDIEETYNGKYFHAKDVRNFENQLEALIEKGENSFLSETEWEYLSKGREEIDRLSRKAIAIVKGNESNYIEIFVEE